MKRSELRSTLGKIRPSEELITKTLGRMEIEKQKRIPKFEVRQSNFSFAYRLAGAMCALILVISAGVYFGRDTVISPVADSATGYQRAAFNADTTVKDTSKVVSINGAEDAAASLSQNAEGSWNVFEGEVVAVKCSPENTVIFSIYKHHASATGYTMTETAEELNNEGVTLTVPDDEVMNALVNSMGANICITVNTDGDVAYVTDYAVFN